MTNNKFIKTILSDTNEFRFETSTLSLFGVNISNANFKVDTGCPYTTIPIQRLNVTSTLAQQYKRNDVNKLINKLTALVDKGCSIKDAVDKERNESFKISYGVESGGNKHEPIDFMNVDSLMQCSAISFKHEVNDVVIKRQGINGNDNIKYPIGNIEVYINYDRKGNILLGMDIMKDWDIHIGTISTGETIFLACPKDQLNDEYYIELNIAFGIGNSILTAEVYND